MVFGLFKKKMPANQREMVAGLAQRAMATISGAIEGDRLVYRDFEIDIADLGERQKLYAALQQLMQDLSRNPDEWRFDLDRIQNDLKAKEATSYEKSAFQFLAGLLQMNVICKAALEYPDDTEVTKMAAYTAMVNAEVIDKALLTREFDPQDPLVFVSINLYSEFLYISRFVKKIAPF